MHKCPKTLCAIFVCVFVCVWMSLDVCDESIHHIVISPTGSHRHVCVIPDVCRCVSHVVDVCIDVINWAYGCVFVETQTCVDVCVSQMCVDCVCVYTVTCRVCGPVCRVDVFMCDVCGCVMLHT